MRLAACRSASISACAVGSLHAIGALRPLPTISPAITTTAPTGTSPCASDLRASASASRMKSSSVPEMPHPRKDHGDAEAVRRGDHLLVAHRSAGLDEGGRAVLRGFLE